MAPKYKIKRKRPPGWLRFIPEPLQAFAARRIFDAFGLMFLLAGGFILLSVVTYDPADPSWNTAGGAGALHNWAGRGGAKTADLLLQTLGLGGAVFGIAFAVWGVSLLRRRPFPL